MCTFLKNRVRFASRASCLTCTKNLAHVALCPRKWCITTYTDVCTTNCVPISSPAAVDLPFDVHPTCRLFKNFAGRAGERGNRMSSRRAVRLGTEPPGATNRGGVHHRAHFFAVFVGERVIKGAAIPSN